MIDTLKIKLNNSHYDRVKLKSFLEENFEVINSGKYEKGSRSNYLTVRADNWTFTLTDKNLNGHGSLTKFQYGNNLTNMPIGDLYIALDKLKSLFNISIDDAIIYRIDVGLNLKVQEKVSNYFDLLVCPNTFKECIYPGETRSFYKNKTEVGLIFYDKIKEMFNENRIPDELKDIMMLRFELRLNKRGLSKIGLISLKFRDLYKVDVLRSLVKEWHERYISIPKLSFIKASHISTNTLNSFKDSIVMEYINNLGGKSNLISLINMRYSTPKTMHDIRKYLNKLFNNTQPLNIDLVSELDQKIYDGYESFL
ncbi:MAG: hypothetical protein ACOH2A_13630 [Sphingobacteriaceae bacterium]